MNSKLESKLKKLLALSRQGVGGEAVNAAAALQKLMDQHGITLDDLEGEKVDLVWFTPGRGAWNRKLFHQVAFSVLAHGSHWKNPGKKGKVGLEVTAAQQVEIELKHSILKKALEDEMKICFRAFIQQNHIYPDRDAGVNDQEPTPEELEELKRVMRMARTMEKVPIHKALT